MKFTQSGVRGAVDTFRCAPISTGIFPPSTSLIIEAIPGLKAQLFELSALVTLGHPVLQDTCTSCTLCESLKLREVHEHMDVLGRRRRELAVEDTQQAMSQGHKSRV